MKKMVKLWPVCGILLLGACQDTEEAHEEPVEEQSADTGASDSAQAEQSAENEIAKEEAAAKETAEEEPQVRYRLNPQTSTLEPIGDAPEEAVLITIDDAPDRHALQMAETLHDLEVPAIFFVNGHFLQTEEDREALKKIHEMGFAIGNHTNTHVNLKQSSEQVQRAEIVTLSETVEEITGETPRFFRAPFGVNTDFSNALVEEQGMVRMNWTYGYDFVEPYMDKEALADIMVNAPELNNGGNLLMHDREWTAEALPDIIQGLRDQGYGFIDPAEIEGVEQ